MSCDWEYSSERIVIAVFWDLLFLICRFHSVNGWIRTPKHPAIKHLLISKDFCSSHIYTGQGWDKRTIRGKENSGRLSHHKVEAKLYNSPEYNRKKPPSVPIEWEEYEAKNPLVPAPATLVSPLCICIFCNSCWLCAWHGLFFTFTRYELCFCAHVVCVAWS